MGLMYNVMNFGLKQWRKVRLLQLAVSMLVFSIVFASLVGAQSSVQSSLTNSICNAFTTVKNVIFILGLTLMILGGALYAGANLMPSSQKGGFQGYGMAMIVGGVVGVAIAVAAPYILNLVVGSSGSSGVTVNAPTAGTDVCVSNGNIFSLF